MTLMAYIDESGDTGNPALPGSSGCYTLGCVLIDLDTWPDAFDNFLNLRKELRGKFNIPMRAELKANYLIRNSGPLRKLGMSPSQRRYVYREHLRRIHAVNGRAFAVVTDKQKVGTEGADCFTMTWEMLLQRLERTCTYEKTTIMISHDNGDNVGVRKIVRKARRRLTAGRMAGGGTFQFKADRILDDPISRDSQHTYFIQLADMVAYAGWRSYIPPSRAIAQVVPQSTWQQVGTATHAAVNQNSLNGSVPGVVLRTR